MLRGMAYFGVRGGDVVVEVAVFRGLVDLMLDRQSAIAREPYLPERACVLHG